MSRLLARLQPIVDARRLDRKRKGKKTSNADWKSKTDSDARIMKIKDDRTHLAYKSEHVVDMHTGVVVGEAELHWLLWDGCPLIPKAVFFNGLLTVSVSLAHVTTRTVWPSRRRNAGLYKPGAAYVTWSTEDVLEVRRAAGIVYGDFVSAVVQVTARYTSSRRQARILS